jgi:hypothetical protein
LNTPRHGNIQTDGWHWLYLVDVNTTTTRSWSRYDSAYPKTAPCFVCTMWNHHISIFSETTGLILISQIWPGWALKWKFKRNSSNSAMFDSVHLVQNMWSLLAWFKRGSYRVIYWVLLIVVPIYIHYIISTHHPKRSPCAWSSGFNIAELLLGWSSVRFSIHFEIQHGWLDDLCFLI